MIPATPATTSKTNTSNSNSNSNTSSFSASITKSCDRLEFELTVELVVSIKQTLTLQGNTTGSTKQIQDLKNIILEIKRSLRALLRGTLNIDTEYRKSRIIPTTNTTIHTGGNSRGTLEEIQNVLKEAERIRMEEELLAYEEELLEKQELELLSEYDSNTQLLKQQQQDSTTKDNNKDIMILPLLLLLLRD